MQWTENGIVEAVLKDCPIVLKNIGLPRQVVFGDRFIYIEMWDLLLRICGLSRQVICHGSGLSR